MKKVIKLYTYVDGINDVPFPSVDDQIEVGSFTYNAKRMGGAPNITFTVKNRLCLDDVWTDKVYTIFNGEKYYLKQIPTSSYDNSDSRYRHEVEMVSERIILENVYFFDVVADGTDNDKPVSNSSNVVFFGDIHEFASRLQRSLSYSHLDYTVIVDDDVESDAKLMSFNDQFFANALQEVYKIFEIPYYFVGKEIHIGHDEYEVEEVFEYGVNNSLLSISKENANYKIVNRCTGDGSSDNIPYYYPNHSPYGKLNTLYNGVISQKINITDWSKFSSYGPSSKLTYTEELQNQGYKQIASLDDFKTVEVKFSGYLLDQPQYRWVAKCPIKIDTPKATVYIYCGFNESAGFDIGCSIVDDNGVTVAQSAFGIFAAVELGYGSYDVYVNIGVGNRPDPESYARDAAFVKVEAAFSSSYKGWRLNDKGIVDLSAMGITFTGIASKGDTISFEIAEGRVPIVGKLMPSIYRESFGAERFYNALNDTYVIPGTNGDKYKFSNPYFTGKTREHIVHFEDIKPSIKEMTNAKGQRIDMFVDFAYDLNDNDEIDENGKYEHPYFYAKLRKFDGQNGFNLFAHAIEGNPMTIAMTSGTCGACQWTIGVDDKSNRNVVQVYEVDTTDANGVFHAAGSLKRNDNGDVLRSGVAQDIQNDTRTNEVWVALKKEESTFGVLMPNANHNYRPSVNDTFVILHISLPEAYIYAAERRLTEAIIKYMSENNDDKFNFSIKFSRIFLEQKQDILKSLNENSLIKVKYNERVYSLHVSSYSYKMSNNSPLPEVIVELSDTITVNRSALQNAINEIKSADGRASFVSESGVSSSRAAANLALNGKSAMMVSEAIVTDLGLKHFVRKKGADTIYDEKTFEDNIFFRKNVQSDDFSRGGMTGTGWGIYKDEQGRTVAEIDKLIARQELEINDLKINQITFDKGTQILSSGGCVVETVEDLDDVYRCYFNNKNGTFFSGFVVGDVALCQRYDESYANIVKNYRRKVVSVSASYVDLSKSEFYGNGTPSKDDNIIQFGNVIDTNRQYVIIRDVVGGGNERMLSDLNSVSSSGVEYYFAGRTDGNTPRWFVGNKSQQFIEYKDGHLQINADVTLGGGSDLSASEEFQNVKQTATQAKQDAQNAEASAKSYADALVKDLQSQLDGKVESFFYNYDPKLDNLPASEWTTDAIKKEHLNDTFTNTESGQSWRWLFKDGSYQWVAIADTQSAEALAKAQEALGVANGKVAVFVTEPRTPYNAKDLWLQGEDGRIKRCTFTRTTTGEFYAEDWVNADDSHEYTDSEIAKYKKSVDATIESLDAAIEAAEKASKDYTDEGKKALQTSIDALNKAKANATDVYDKATADGLINQAEADAIAAAQEFAASAKTLAEETAKAYADGVVDEEEEARIKQAQENLNAAKEYAEGKAKEAEDNAKEYADTQISSYDLTIKYLKDAFNQGSVLDVDGVTLSALVGVKDENKKVVAGLYGGGSDKLNDEGYADKDYGAMLLFGGIEGVDKPTTYKTAIFENGYIISKRFQTSKEGKRVEIFDNKLLVYGDDANNSVLSISYDSTGKPRLQYTNESGKVAWYLSDSGISTSYTVEQADKTFVKLAGDSQSITAQHNFTNGLKIGGVSLRKVDDYLYLDSSLVLSGGVTMYGDDGTTVKPIWESIPLDSSTLAWLDGKLSVIGGGGGGGISEEFLNVKLQGYQPLLSTANKLPYTLISGTPDLSVYAKTTDIPTLAGYATQTWVEGKGYLLATTASSTYQPKITSSNKLAYSLISGTPTIPTKLSQLTDDLVEGNYLSTKGGTISGSITATSFIGNLTGNADSATKLATARTIWGQSFDGSNNIDGTIDFRKGKATLVATLTDDGTKAIFLQVNQNNNCLLGQQLAKNGGDTIIYGNSIKFAYGTYGSTNYTAININNNGNVAIGGTTADAKLHVRGTAKFTDDTTFSSKVVIGTIPVYESVDGTLYVDANVVFRGGVAMYGNTTTTINEE